MQMLGANPKGQETEFRLWAPLAKRVMVRLISAGGAGRDLEMEKHGDTFVLRAEAGAGGQYFYLLNDDPLPLPDPVSRYLPKGVHGPTQVVDPAAFAWTDQDWRGVEYQDYVLYELHVGTFTPAATFDGVLEKLDYLHELGVTAIELMPVGAFPGRRNWGYDGASMYAVQESYGGPESLKRLVDAAHAKGLAVLLDVVYNHLGAEGNYLSRFGPYFTSKHKTPWGDALNYDDKQCEGARNYVRENALYWIREYHLDGLRMDAVHTIQDESKTHILAEIRDAVQEYAAKADRRVCLIVESDENSRRYVRPRPDGFGMDGVWSDDFHHAIHAIATGENDGYYGDFGGTVKLAKALTEGFVFQGEEFKFWGRPRGESSKGMSPEAHVICIQNHDQVGNRAPGERLTELVPPEMRKIMAAILLLAPETPLLFMGQESDEPSPFQFFTDFGDSRLKKAVTEGRRKEFEGFSSFEREVPDPQDPLTYERSKLTWDFTPERREALDFYRYLIRLRAALYACSPRSGCARPVGGTGIELQIPAGNPKLLLRATWDGTSWDGKVSPSPGEISEQAVVLENHEFKMEVRVSPEITKAIRPLRA